MNLDSGIAKIWRGTNTSPPGSLPVIEYNTLYFSSYYGDKTVGITRFWTAKAQDDRADALIQVQRNAGISTADRCELTPYFDEAAAGMYKILQCQQVTDEDGNPMTDLTLQRIEAIENG